MSTNLTPGDALPGPADREQEYLPPVGKPRGKVDPDVYDAWKKHTVMGFQQNSEMFRKLLDAFMRPYWLTVWMYRTLYIVGLAGFVVAALLSVWRGWEFAAIFGGISVVTFLAFFIGQPLRALEQNLEFITWLGLIYNTYWTRLMYANDAEKMQADLEAINKAAVADLSALIDKHVAVAAKRPGAEAPKDPAPAGDKPPT
ncbi:MAG: hypothetical protein HZB53_11610 [Chloroflexi bacterium]|nr:hypothetical protein [Chloroflexota bacterium]